MTQLAATILVLALTLVACETVEPFPAEDLHLVCALTGPAAPSEARLSRQELEATDWNEVREGGAPLPYRLRCPDGKRTYLLADYAFSADRRLASISHMLKADGNEASTCYYRRSDDTWTLLGCLTGVVSRG
jgi:hypothetical protein